MGRAHPLHELFEKRYQFDEFNIVLVIEPRLDGYTIVKLIAERLRTVVDDDRTRHVSTQDRQVLDVIAVHAHAVLAEQPMSKACFIQQQRLQVPFLVFFGF
jgi:uncharacterized membrane protein